MGLSKEMKDSSTYSNMLVELPTFVTVWQIQDSQILQKQAEKAAQNTWGVGIASSPKQLEHPKDPSAAPAGLVAGYSRPVPVDLSSGKIMISAEDVAKKFADGWCLYCGGLNHRAAECSARKKAETFKAAGAGVKEVVTGTGSEELGND